MVISVYFVRMFKILFLDHSRLLEVERWSSVCVIE